MGRIPTITLPIPWWPWTLVIRLNLLDPKPGQKILDAGCGTGRNLTRISSAGARRMDWISRSACCASPEERCRTCPLVQADLQAEFPFRNAEFSAVLCALIGEHLDNLALHVVPTLESLGTGRLVGVFRLPSGPGRSRQRSELPTGTNGISFGRDPLHHGGLSRDDMGRRISRNPILRIQRGRRTGHANPTSRGVTREAGHLRAEGPASVLITPSAGSSQTDPGCACRPRRPSARSARSLSGSILKSSKYSIVDVKSHHFAQHQIPAPRQFTELDGEVKPAFHVDMRFGDARRLHQIARDSASIRKLQTRQRQAENRPSTRSSSPRTPRRRCSPRTLASRGCWLACPCSDSGPPCAPGRMQTIGGFALTAVKKLKARDSERLRG